MPQGALAFMRRVTPRRLRRWPARVWAEVTAARLMGAYGGRYGGRLCFCGRPMLLTREIEGARELDRIVVGGGTEMEEIVNVQLVWRCPPCLATAQQWTDRFDPYVDTEAHI